MVFDSKSKDFKRKTNWWYYKWFDEKMDEKIGYFRGWFTMSEESQEFDRQLREEQFDKEKKKWKIVKDVKKKWKDFQ